MRVFLTTLLALVLLTTIPAPGAFGQGRPARGEAILLYGEAKELFERGEFAAAIAKLDGAYESFPDSNILVKKAQCYEKLLEPEKALHFYEQALHLHGTGLRLTPVYLSKVETTIKALQAELERPVRVSILCNVPGAEIRIDGRLHIAPVVADLPRGDHTVAAQAEGWIPLPPRALLVKGVGEQTLYLTMNELSGQYLVDIKGTSRPKEVRVDGEALPETAWTGGRQRVPRESRAGHHELVCIYPEGAAWTEFTVLKDLTVEVDCPAPPVTPPPPAPTRSKVWEPLAFAAGIGMIAASGVLFAGYAEARDLPGRCNTSVRTSKLGWGIGLGAAGLAATGVGTYYLFFHE
ncbi:MAG: hypothetical protein ABIK09_16080 [Pseudomonadota bacterium]